MIRIPQTLFMDPPMNLGRPSDPWWCSPPPKKKGKKEEIIGSKPRPPCSEVLCLGILTFEQGVAWLTGSYSMAVRPIEEHPCVLRGKGTQIKYAIKMLRALLNAKPNISSISVTYKVKYGDTCNGFDPTLRVRWAIIFISINSRMQGSKPLDRACGPVQSFEINGSTGSFVHTGS